MVSWYIMFLILCIWWLSSKIYYSLQREKLSIDKLIIIYVKEEVGMLNKAESAHLVLRVMNHV